MAVTPDSAERPRPWIIAYCIPCGVEAEDDDENRVTVSPQQLAHFGIDGGRTKCGKDATGDAWWWPL